MPLRLLRKLKRTNTLSTVSSASEPPDLETATATSHEAAITSQEPFFHTDLPDPSEDIRLIRRTRNGPSISFDLFYVKRSAAPPYIALSYSRDADAANEDGKLILLNGKSFTITSGLYRALHHDCIPYESCAWIEAMCINQGNQHESSLQLQNKRSTFSKATQTVAWIGEDHSNEVGSLLQLAQDFPQTRQRYASESQWCMANAASIVQNISDTDAIQYLLKRPYWSHLWVLQEIAWSQNVVIQCGPLHASLASVEAILKSIAFFPSDETEDYEELNKIFIVRQAAQQKPNILTLGNCLELFQAMPNVIDPGDDLYSVLGLATDSIPFSIDYDVPVEIIFTNLMIHRLQTESLDILGESQPNDQADHASLPSWVPDLRIRRLRSYTRQFLLPFGSDSPLHPVASATDLSGLTGTRANLAIGSSNPSCKDLSRYHAASTTNPTIRFSDVKTQIEILGRRVSEITVIANACSSATFGSNRVQAWLSKQYNAQRFKAAAKWAPIMSTNPHYDTKPTFWNEPGKPLYPATDQDKKQLAWDQLMNPYAKYPEYWAFLDLSMGPSPRRMCRSDEDHSSCDPADEATDSDAFRRQVDFFDGARRAFQTSVPQQYGLGPGRIRVGDVLVVLDGASVPHVLRSVEGTDTWRYIGEAYVGDIMRGEAMERSGNPEYFTLV